MDDAGKKMWERAKQVIPGGSSLLSKRAEMHLPSFWPSYYQSAKGCEIDGIDGKTYIDVSFMGVGTNVLGYSFDPIDNAVLLAIKQGNLSTLNCYEEVLLAEKLIEMTIFPRWFVLLAQEVRLTLLL